MIVLFPVSTEVKCRFSARGEGAEGGKNEGKENRPGAAMGGGEMTLCRSANDQSVSVGRRSFEITSDRRRHGEPRAVTRATNKIVERESSHQLCEDLASIVSRKELSPKAIARRNLHRNNDAIAQRVSRRPSSLFLLFEVLRGDIFAMRLNGRTR